jgi:spermidine/putrescine transport system substrate-binding protein
MGAALVYLGLDPNTTNPDDINKATDLLLKTKKDVKVFAPDTGQDLLVQGDVDIAYEYSGDIFQVQADHPDIHYVIPKEGSIIWTDNLCIPKGAPHADLAHKFLDYILDAQNGADLSNFTQYGTPNAASLPLIDAALRSNPSIYPSPELRKKLHFLVSVGDADALFTDAWTKLGVGQ